MATKAKKIAFDPKVFLATVDGGRTMADYPTDQVVFSQGLKLRLRIDCRGKEYVFCALRERPQAWNVALPPS